MAAVTQPEFVRWVRDAFLGSDQRRLSVHVRAPPEERQPPPPQTGDLAPLLVTDVAAFKKGLATYPQPHAPLPPLAATSAPRAGRGRARGPAAAAAAANGVEERERKSRRGGKK